MVSLKVVADIESQDNSLSIQTDHGFQCVSGYLKRPVLAVNKIDKN